MTAARRNFSRQSSASSEVRPYLRAASCTEVSPLMMLTINAERLLAVHRWTSSGSSSLTITTSCHDFTMAYGWLQIGGEQDNNVHEARPQVLMYDRSATWMP